MGKLERMETLVGVLWLVTSEDGDIISEHHTKGEAKAALCEYNNHLDSLFQNKLEYIEEMCFSW